ncbi:MAG: peptidoglycan DD-metalloendopeptidase family protein [Bacteroidaceae bacterium]|nr:peptidoglycan DD-metalloendopeptidase family protein [Bacteroidaceae bacterium]
MKIFKTLFLCAIMAIGMTTIANAQDLMAREAKADFQLKSSNIVSKIINQAKMNEEVNYAKNIYGNSWNNDGVNVYKGMARPEELVINLKDFSMPIKSRIVTSNFGYRARFRRNHYGTDINGCTGDTIYAAFAGKVRVRKYDAKGFGYYIVLRHNNGLETVYGHLSKQLVNVNQEVRSGQPIGLCGNTGHSFGSHLHFETRVLGEAINPALMFDFAAADIVSDTYTYRSKGNTVPVAEPVLAQNKSQEVQEKQEVQEAKAVAAKPKAKTPARKSVSHKVQQGETLSSIARKHNTTVAEICRRNGIKQNATLRLGQNLTVK